MKRLSNEAWANLVKTVVETGMIDELSEADKKRLGLESTASVEKNKTDDSEDPEDRQRNPKKKEDDKKDYKHKYANDQEYMRVYNEEHSRDDIINALATTDLSVPEITDLLTQLADKSLTEETLPTEQFRKRIEIIKALNVQKT